MDDQQCVVDGCSRINIVGRGLCSGCYTRNSRRGTLANYPKIRVRSAIPCTVDGCERIAVKLTLCDRHYLRLRRTGTTEDQPPARGADSCSWVGDAVSYDGAHDRVRRARGRAHQFLCIDDCGRQAQEWSYRGGSDKELIGPTSTGRGKEPRLLPYSPDPADYEPRCIGCHRRYDEVALKRWATERDRQPA